MLVFWVVTPFELVGDTNVSEGHAASTFTVMSTRRYNPEVFQIN
jgi:hypothetical protein